MLYSDLAIATKLASKRQEAERLIASLDEGAAFSIYVPGSACGNIDFSKSSRAAPDSLVAEIRAAAQERIEKIDAALALAGVKIDGPIKESGDDAVDSVFGIETADEEDGF
jgi:hypothetical protein